MFLERNGSINHENRSQNVKMRINQLHPSARRHLEGRCVAGRDPNRTTPQKRPLAYFLGLTGDRRKGGFSPPRAPIDHGGDLYGLVSFFVCLHNFGVFL